MWKEAVGA